MDNRPIRFNKNGKYNLDFIDWNNEWERVGEVACRIENGEELSDKEEEARVRKHMQIDEEKFGVKLHVHDACYMQSFSFDNKVFQNYAP